MNLSLLVHTFNDYQHLWPGCLQAWRNTWVWGDDVANLYFATDRPDHQNHDFRPFKVLYSGAGQWSDRLINILRQIKTEYVLYCQEDHYPTKEAHWLAGKTGIVTKNDLFRLQLSPVNRFYKLEGSEIPLFFDPESKYLVSHQPSIWKKSFLLDCLKPNETPWQNEYEGTKRLQITSQMREYVRGKIAIYPCDWYSHRCIKGQVVKP